MLENINDHLKAQDEPMKAALVELVRIPSVLDETAQDTPYGEAIDQALCKALQIAGELGFKTRYGDGGYHGIAETSEGEEIQRLRKRLHQKMQFLLPRINHEHK